MAEPNYNKMGSESSCFSKSVAVENGDNTVNMERQQEKNKYESGKVDGEEEAEIVQDIVVEVQTDPVLIQSAVRGYFSRKAMNEKRQDRNNVFHPEDHFVVIQEPLEELENSKIKEAEGKLPEFKIEVPEGDNTKVSVKPAMKLDDGSVYQGTWDEKGQMHGVGTLLTEDGAKIVGYFKGSKLEGKGRAIEPSGLVYQGDFKEGKFDGEGQFLRKNGAKFVGSLKDGKLNGEGSEEWPDGTKYVGGYLDGERHGKGKLTLKDGAFYEGEFKNSIIHGKGTYVWANKNEYKGKWRNNQMDGRGVFKWADGRSYDGEWKGDLRDGNGEMSWPDGRKYIGGWKEGKQHGKGVYHFKNKEGNPISKEGSWENGDRIDVS